MARIDIIISKADVFAEVRKTSEYIGSKSQDAAAYDRIALVTANDEQLERFWRECCASSNAALSRWLAGDTSDGAAYRVALCPSSSWVTALQGTVVSLLKSYFIQAILGKWLAVCGSGGASGYVELAAATLQSVKDNMYELRSPARPTDG